MYQYNCISRAPFKIYPILRLRNSLAYSSSAKEVMCTNFAFFFLRFFAFFNSKSSVLFPYIFTRTLNHLKLVFPQPRPVTTVPPPDERRYQEVFPQNSVDICGTGSTRSACTHFRYRRCNVSSTPQPVPCSSWSCHHWSSRQPHMVNGGRRVSWDGGREKRCEVRRRNHSSSGLPVVAVRLSVTTGRCNIIRIVLWLCTYLLYYRRPCGASDF